MTDFFNTHRRFRSLTEMMSEIAMLSQPSESSPERRAIVEARTIKAIVDFELANNKDDATWTFKDGGLTRVVEDFFLVSEYVEGEQSDRFRQWCLSLGRLSLTTEEGAELDQVADEKTRNEKLIEKVQPPLKPLVMFFVALCHALQEDDDELSATDGYWLGLVDEVMGESSLLTLRMFAEYQDEPPEKQDEERTDATEEKTGTTGANAIGA